MKSNKKLTVSIWKDAKSIKNGITGLIKDVKENNEIEVAQGVY